jgi:1,4-dihydroxy-2-naphthoate octaprenyltransferase
MFCCKVVTVKPTLNLWIKGARPKTLPAAVAPVLVGVACASIESSAEHVWANGLFALVVSLALQVAVNFANDYSDGIRGTDIDRVGPMRLVGSGAKEPKEVKQAAFAAFGVAAVFGLILAAATSWWLIAVGLACIAAGWFYTGGSKPYGYYGFGELFVFIFFGLVATTGTTFVVIQKISYTSFVASIAVGSLACALLVINNLRDIPGDTVAGKKTLAVRLGDKQTRRLYYSLLVVSGLAILLLAVDLPSTLIGLLGLLAAMPAIRRVMRGAVGKDLIDVLGATGRTQILTAVALSAGLLLA